MCINHLPQKYDDDDVDFKVLYHGVMSLYKTTTKVKNNHFQ